MMREYIGERVHALDNPTMEPELREKALEWIAWAKQYVERIDPLNRGFGMTEITEFQPGSIDEDSDETS